MSLKRPSIPLLLVGWRLTTLGNSGCRVTTQLMLHRDHRTFGKQHRSCKHPIHIPLVEWHCGKRSCHVNLVICVEGHSILIHVFASYQLVTTFDTECRNQKKK
ncbi:hypothetical protein L210DRAFT_3590249 [Boletus edulis BED1]|uniref:Secreted protein n=1 Tax=Boletus edulis BED1 TaxID=1328754 RepID=A0AAD4B9B7_BOLED|nr:hypothetical protein L210DRAFT_3590249 [Boletus edulis BED1]